jgi:hypothetical protein
MPAKNVTVKAKIEPRYSRWFRMYSEIIDDSKVQRLCPSLFKAWVNILALASQNEGKVPHSEEIAFRLRMSINDTSAAIDELIHTGLIDILPDGSFTPHNWGKRQFKWDGTDRTAADRMRRMRERKKRSRYGRVTGGVTEIPSESVSVSTVATSKSIQGKNSTTNARTSAPACTRDDEVLS